MLQQTFLALALAALSNAHTVAWVKGMYCLGGNNTAVDDSNTNLAVNPLYNLTQSDWWFQHGRGCDAAPPAAGDILNLPAGGTFTVELAHNRAQTTLSYGGQYASEWPDGNTHPEDWSGPGSPPDCIQDDGAMHTNNQSMAAGTAFAISYTPDLNSVTMENLVVFTTLSHTPWKRLATYSVPAALPACPPGGCHCAWLWVPNGCGQPNMYMAGYRCNVTGATGTAPLAKAQPPVYCGDDSSKCVKGAKQMIAWNQLTGNNIQTGPGQSPAYGANCGWSDGAQNDIFQSVSSSVVSSSETSSAGVGSSSTSVSKVVVANVSASSPSSSRGAVVSTPVPSNSSSASTLAASHSPSCTPVTLMSTVTETKVVTSVQYVTLHKRQAHA